MSFGFIPLASSSRGNVTLIETPQTRVVVDMGISFKRFRKELETHSISLATIDRLYITHAHTDHMSGLEQFMRQTNIPVFTRRKTLEVLRRKFSTWSFDLDRVELISDPVHQLNDLIIRYFRLPHEGWSDKMDDDTGDHIGFVFEWKGQKLSFMTDCGHLTEGVKKLIKASDAYVIESNYDEALQMSSSRAWMLKKRIMGDRGHLSNKQTAEYLKELIDPELTKRVFLAHLSLECNTHELAKQTVIQTLAEHYKDAAMPIEINTLLGQRYPVV